MIGLPILARLPWGWIGAAVAVLGALWWAYDAGRDAERAKWMAKVAEQERVTRAREGALQDQVDAAGVALSDASAEIQRLAVLANQKRSVFYAANPGADVACLLPERVRAVAEADAAATAAVASK